MAESLLTGSRRGRTGSISGRTVDLRQNLFRIPDNISVALGLRWDFIGAEPVDLDASCVAFDDEGNCVDVVFFNHLKGENPVFMEHTGDNQTGESDEAQPDDESMILHMSLIPPNVFYLMVCVTSYTGADFTLVERASCRLINLATKESVGEFQLGIVGRHTATLLCSFSRVPPDASPVAPIAGGGGSQLLVPPAATHQSNQMTWWDLREINFPCAGYTFVDVLPKMMDFLGVSEDQREIRMGSLPDYSLAKEEEKNVTLSQMKMGLGWDGENDLDAALIFLGSDTRYVDHVYAKFGRLKSREGAAVHSGDKLNGYDVAGDDEFIDIDLNKIEKDVTYIFFVGLLYDGFAKTMGSVPHAYLRIINRSSPMDKKIVELQRFSLVKNGGDSTAIIFSYAHRTDAAHWEFVAVEECTTGRDYVDIFPMVRCIAAHHGHAERWRRWKKKALIPLALEVTVLEAKDLGPLEPHQFACHIRAWVQDKKGKGRVSSSICNDRDNVHWGAQGEGERFVFAVNRMDVIRVLVYEHALVGIVDLEVKYLADALSPEPKSTNILGNRQTTSSSVQDMEMVEMNAERESSVPGEGKSDRDGVAGGDSEGYFNNEGLGDRQVTSVSACSVSALGSQPSFSIVTSASNELVIEDWFPLRGRDITGELKLRIRQVPLTEVPTEEDTDSGESWWCAVS